MEKPRQSVLRRLPAFSGGGDQIQVLVKVDQGVAELVGRAWLANALVDGDSSHEIRLRAVGAAHLLPDLQFIGSRIFRQRAPINVYVIILRAQGRHDEGQDKEDKRKNDECVSTRHNSTFQTCAVSRRMFYSIFLLFTSGYLWQVLCGRVDDITSL